MDLRNQYSPQPKGFLFCENGFLSGISHRRQTQKDAMRSQFGAKHINDTMFIEDFV
jgi:hypothetical protein